MTSAALQISDMLNTLEKEDYEMAISYIQFLSDKRSKERKFDIEGSYTSDSETKGIKLGLFNGMKYIADGHDIDECNGEIAELFGVAVIGRSKMLV